MSLILNNLTGHDQAAPLIAIPAPGHVYRFDSSATPGLDTVGGENLTLNGTSAMIVQGKRSNSLMFINHGTNLLNSAIPLGAFSASGWVRANFNELSTQGSISVFYGGSIIPFSAVQIRVVNLVAGDGLLEVRFTVSGPSGYSQSRDFSVANNTWFHWGLAITEGVSLLAMVDDTMQTIDNSPFPAFSDADTCSIGGTVSWDGMVSTTVDEYYLWPGVVLTDAQLRSLRNAGNGRFYPFT